MDKSTQKFFADILSDEGTASSAVKTAEPVESKKPASVSNPVQQKPVNAKLKIYIAEELKHGVSLSDVKKGLMAAHWPEEDIDTGLAQVKLQAKEELKG